MRYLLIFLALCVGHSTLAAAKQPGDVVRLEMDCSATKNKQAGPWKHDFYGLITDNGLSFVGHWAHRSSRDPGEVFFNSFDGRINEAKRSAAIKGSIRRVKKSWVNEWFFKKDNVSSFAEALAGAGMKGRENKGEWQRQCTMRLIKSGSVADALGNFKQLADDRQQRLITINRDLNKLRDQAADAKAETTRLNSRVATLNAQLFGTKKRIENLEADLAKSQSTPVQTKQLESLQDELRLTMKQRDEAVRKETEVKALLGQITFELNEAKTGNTKLFGDLKRTEAKLAAATADADNKDSEKLAALDVRLNSALQQLSEVSAEKGTLTEELGAKDTKIKQLEQQIQKNNADLTALRREMFLTSEILEKKQKELIALKATATASGASRDNNNASDSDAASASTPTSKENSSQKQAVQNVVEQKEEPLFVLGPSRAKRKETEAFQAKQKRKMDEGLYEGRVACRAKIMAFIETERRFRHSGMQGLVKVLFKDDAAKFYRAPRKLLKEIQNDKLHGTNFGQKTFGNSKWLMEDHINLIERNVRALSVGRSTSQAFNDLYSSTSLCAVTTYF